MHKRARVLGRLGRNRVQHVWVIGVVSLMLTGCETIPSDPMGLQIEDSALRAVVCGAEGTVRRTLIEQRPVGGEWSAIVDSRAEIVISGDHVLETNPQSLPMLIPVAFEAGTEVVILIELAQGSHYRADFVLPEPAEVSDSDWIRQDRTISTTPCTAKQG